MNSVPTVSGKNRLCTASGWVNRPYPWPWPAGWPACGAATACPPPASSADTAHSAPANVSKRDLANITYSLPVAEPQVEGRQHEQAEQRGGEQPAEDDDRERVLDLVSRPRAQHHQRDQGKPGGQRGHQDRGEPLAGPAQHQVPAELHSFLLLQVLAVVDQQDPVAGRDAEHGEEADQRAE